jgi:hypothetical protein
VAIDLELVQMAFEDRDGDGKWFLDTATGEAVHVNEHGDDDELRSQIEEGFGERYLRIPYQGSDAAYRDMEEFIDSGTDDRCRGLLDVAIRGKGAFRRFKDVLQAHPAERERWFAFQKERVHDRIRRWLEGEDIEPVTRQPSSG